MSTETLPHTVPAHPRGRELRTLALAALGVVYGDIGTSPLYAFRESFGEYHKLAVIAPNVLGVLSLVVWSLVLVVTVKYIAFILRADNRGEGGILALTALATPMRGPWRGTRVVLISLGLFGTALVFGDGMITPAISVLSAVEGLAVARPGLEPWIVPLTIGILIGLFGVQRHGTAGIGAVFGPVMLVWFAAIAALGLVHVVRAPDVLRAISPAYAVSFFTANGMKGFLVLGSVFLAVTGGEALYADLGHFGRQPIRSAWFTIVLPSLLLNYLGQGALILHHPEAIASPFYLLAPDWALYPLIALATAATVIASQALITGVFSLAMQAVQLGYTPRLAVRHTSALQRGQIVVPAMNRLLLLSCIGLVLGFGSSSNLAAAYGVAVTAAMMTTTLLFYAVVRDRWRWSLPLALGVCGPFLAIDLAYLGANLFKIPEGGWFPLVVGGLAFVAMTTWKTGRRILAKRMEERVLPVDVFLADVAANPPTRVPGVAVFMYSRPYGVPPALLHSFKHYKVIHEHTVFLTVITEDVPRVSPEQRLEVTPLPHGFHRIVLRFGFMEDPDVPAALRSITLPGVELKPMETTYFLGRETLIATKRPGMALWREKLFAIMSRNATSATNFYGLPPNRVVELGAQIEL